MAPALRPVAAFAAALTLSACAADVGDRYREVAQSLSLGGGLRTDYAPADAPFDDADLARNFERIALAREYDREDGELVLRTTATPINRWSGPIRYRVIGGGATEADRRAYRRLAGRLSELSGLEIVEVEADQNLSILILTEAERGRLAADLEADGTAERMPIILEWTEDLRYPCVGQIAYEERATGEITAAMIAVKAELEGTLRTSCIHEEFAQTLGLINDDDDVRPSIFNDDQEFALLTEHDEYLVRILYDRRLAPGMTAEEVRPLLAGIVSDVRSAPE